MAFLSDMLQYIRPNQKSNYKNSDNESSARLDMGCQTGRTSPVSPSPLLRPPESAPLPPQRAEIYRSSSSDCTETAAGSQSSPGLLHTQPSQHLRVLTHCRYVNLITRVTVFLYGDGRLSHRSTCCICPFRWL